MELTNPTGEAWFALTAMALGGVLEWLTLTAFLTTLLKRASRCTNNCSWHSTQGEQR